MDGVAECFCFRLANKIFSTPSQISNPESSIANQITMLKYIIALTIISTTHASLTCVAAEFNDPAKLRSKAAVCQGECTCIKTFFFHSH